MYICDWSCVIGVSSLPFTLIFLVDIQNVSFAKLQSLIPRELVESRHFSLICLYHSREVRDLIMYICDRCIESASYYYFSIGFKGETMIYAKHFKLKIEQHEPKKP